MILNSTMASPSKKLRVVELFAGVGGFRLGLEGWKGKSSTSSRYIKVSGILLKTQGIFKRLVYNSITAGILIVLIETTGGVSGFCLQKSTKSTEGKKRDNILVNISTF